MKTMARVACRQIRPSPLTHPPSPGADHSDRNPMARMRAVGRMALSFSQATGSALYGWPIPRLPDPARRAGLCQEPRTAQSREGSQGFIGHMAETSETIGALATAGRQQVLLDAALSKVLLMYIGVPVQRPTDGTLTECAKVIMASVQ